jgi:hypothetical protein
MSIRNFVTACFSFNYNCVTDVTDKYNNILSKNKGIHSNILVYNNTIKAL